VDFFEAIPLAAPVGDHHHLVIADRPDLYPLTRVLDGYPRYLAVLADTHVARIFLFALNDTEQTTQIESTKTRRHKMGGWSQARYQRHVEHFHQQHAREVVDVVARLVRNERIDRILLAGNDVIMPLLRAELPNDLAHKVIDVMSLDIRAGEREVLDATLASIHEKEAESDRERVDAMVAAFRAGGLACVGEQRTRRALERGQVHELLIAANADDQPSASDLVASARRTGARIRFIEDAALLEAVGGVGALLRFAL
jgi:peptide subunit release factor 1 (eRF1)